MLSLIIHQVDIVGAYLEDLLRDNELPIFIKLLLRICNLHQIQEGLFYNLLRNLYDLKLFERL